MNHKNIEIKTLDERNRDELENRIGRQPTGDELTVKNVAEEEAQETIKATPSHEYVPQEVIEPHFKRVAEALGRCPTDIEKELFREIFTEEVHEENIDREMRM